MAKKIFLSDIDLALNQLLQAKLENLASDPTGTESRIYYNTVIKKVKYFNGTVWLTVVDDIDSRLTNARTPSAHVLATNAGLGGEHTISGAALGWVLRASGATTANFQQLAHADLANVGTNTHTQIDIHIGDATKHRIINDSGSSNTELFSASKILQLIADINTTVAGSLVYKGGYNAATNTPLLDTTPIAVQQGWTYIVTTEGAFFTEDVQIGDMIIAKQTNPTALAHWTVINKNIPDIVAAAEATAGIIRIATQVQANLGIDNLTAVTPLKLHSFLGVTSSLNVARKFSQAIGDGTALTYTVTHNLATRDINAQVVRVAAPYDIIDCEIVATSFTTATFNFNVAPTSGQYRVVIIG